MLTMTDNTQKSVKTIDNSGNLSRRGEIFYHSEALAKELVETFGGHHMTPARRLAARLIIEMPTDIEENERIDYITSALDNDETITKVNLSRHRYFQRYGRATS